jgi:hypothetical protein
MLLAHAFPASTLASGPTSGLLVFLLSDEVAEDKLNLLLAGPPNPFSIHFLAGSPLFSIIFPLGVIKRNFGYFLFLPSFVIYLLTWNDH